MPLRLAFSSNAYLDVPVETAIERIAAAGYRGIELLADVPHAWPAGLLAGQKAAIRRALQDHGLVISNINAFMMNAVADPRQPYWHPGWTDPDPHYRAIRREHTKRALGLAAELGEEVVERHRLTAGYVSHLPSTNHTTAASSAVPGLPPDQLHAMSELPEPRKRRVPDTL